jgi:hypothetical protein
MSSIETLAKPTEVVSILVLEDNPQHQSQMRDALIRSGYDVEVISDVDEDQLLNYKAGHSDREIVIVDLDLGSGANDPIHNGMVLARKRIWPLDRGTVFVVFSQFFGNDLGIPREFNRVDPQCAFVTKEVDGSGLIREGSLDDLLDVLVRVRDVIIPSLHQPHYSALEALHLLESYVRAFGGGGGDFSRIAQSIVRAVDTVNELAREAMQYARIGADAARLSIAVYGSAGRLELRADSDVEFSVYPETGDHDALQQSVSLWNRMFMFCEHRGFRPEGASIVNRNSPRLLRVADVGEGGRNGYAPILPTNWLLDEKAARVANIRNRHRQLLFETRAIFNRRAVNRLKRSILNKYVMKGGKDAPAIWGSPYWESVLAQFELDAGLRGFRTRADIKTFCHRTMGIFATRLFLIEQIMLAAEKGGGLSDWDDAKLDEMCRPAFLKLLSFSVRIGERDQSLMKLMRDLVTAFGNLLVRMDEAGYEGKSDEDDSLIQNCAEDARRIADTGIQVIRVLTSHPLAAVLQMRPWLLNHPEFAHLSSQR